MQHFFTITLSVVLLAACGPKASVEDSRKIDPPKFEIAKNGFYLNEGGFEKSFSGPMLIWAPDVSAKKMAKVVKTSDHKLDVGVEKLKYLRDNALVYADEFYSKSARAQALAIEGGQLFFKMSLMNAAQWYAGSNGQGGELAVMSQKLAAVSGQGLQPHELAHAGNYFYAYCEAKLWQRALFHLTMEEKYFRRPTPLALCEGAYLQGRLILETAPLCAPTTRENTKSYFSCLWQEGVLKTKLFQSRYGPASSHPETGQILSTLSEDALKKFFGDKLDKNFREFLAQEQNSSLSIPSVDGNTTTVVPLSWEFIPARASEDDPTSLGNASAGEIIDSMEKNAEFAADGVRMLPVSTRAEAEQPVLNTEIKALRAKVRSFTTLSEGRFVNEVRFNQPFAAAANTEITVKDNFMLEAGKNFPSVFNVQSPELAAIQAEALKLKSELLVIGTNVQQANEYVSNPQNCDSQPESLACQDATVSAESMASLTPKDVSLALFQAGIELHKDTDKGQLLVNVYLDGRRKNELTPFRGCIELDKNSASCKDDDSVNAKAKFDEETGIITLTKRVKNPGAFGFNYVPRSNLILDGVDFNVIPPEYVEDQKFSFSFSLNNVDDVLTTLMGSFSIDDYQGSIKLSEDAPPIRVEMEELANALRQLQK